MLFLSSINLTINVKIKNFKTKNNIKVDKIKKKSTLIVILIN